MPEDQFGTYGEGMTRQPDMDDPAIAYAERAMEALRQEFKDDSQAPRFVIVVETPPDGEILTSGGRLGIASTGDDELDTYRLALLAALAVRRSMDADMWLKAKQVWTKLEDEFMVTLIERNR